MKTSIRHLLIATILLLGSSIQASLGKELFSAKVIEKAKKAVVTIHGSASLKAYDDKSNAWSGTGFIIDKHQGHVLTNAHIVGRAVIGTYHLFFYDGTRADAKLLYYDPWLDYAFLQVDPTTIPHGATEIKFSSKDPVMDQPVFIIGNNEGKSFSTHTGTVTGLYEIAGNLPQHSIRLSLNTRGGSSGSPVMNQQGEAIALHYGGSDTFGIGLHAAYIRYVLGFIAKGKSPIRKHIGVITEIYSLNEAAKYRDFPNDKIQAYNKKFPLSLGNAIQVSRTLPGSPAEGRLMAGDIIWAVNGQEIGPSLVELDLAMNMAEKDSVRLTIFRDGQWQEVDMLLYNLEDHKITQMVSFGGALFFEADDFFSDKTGMPAKTLTFAIAQSSATFNQVMPYFSTEQGRIFFLKLLTLNQTPVANLAQLMHAIPKLIQKKYFTISYINYLPQSTNFGNWYIFAHNYHKADVAYDENSPEPRLFTFDTQQMEWKSEFILQK